MKKLILNQIKHRFCRMRSVWVLYGLFVIFTFPRSYYFDEGMTIDVDYVLYRDDAKLFLMIALFLIVAQSFKLYADYKRGSIRWSILTNKKQAFIIGDVCFIAMSVIALYVIYVVCLCFQIEMKLEALDKAKAFVYLAKPSVVQVIQQTEITNLLIPMKLSGYLLNLLLLVMVVENCVCLSFVAIRRRIKLFEVMCFIACIFILYYAFQITIYINIVLCIIVIAGCFKLCMTLWREVSTC